MHNFIFTYFLLSEHSEYLEYFGLQSKRVFFLIEENEPIKIVGDKTSNLSPILIGKLKNDWIGINSNKTVVHWMEHVDHFNWRDVEWLQKNMVQDPIQKVPNNTPVIQDTSNQNVSITSPLTKKLNEIIANNKR